MKDMFNTTFFFLLGIIIIGVAGIYLYFENKLKDNTHKLNSMLNLVTSVTEEVRQIKFFLSSKNQPPNNYPVNKINSQNGGNNLIEYLTTTTEMKTKMRMRKMMTTMKRTMTMKRMMRTRPKMTMTTMMTRTTRMKQKSRKIKQNLMTQNY